MVNRDTKSRKKIKSRANTLGTALRPRLSVFKSNNNIYIQAINDLDQKTVAASSTLSLAELPKAKVSQAEVVGKALAEKLKVLNIETAVFDRGSYKYHGRVKSLADGVRSGGIKF